MMATTKGGILFARGGGGKGAHGVEDEDEECMRILPLFCPSLFLCPFLFFLSLITPPLSLPKALSGSQIIL